MGWERVTSGAYPVRCSRSFCSCQELRLWPRVAQLLPLPREGACPLALAFQKELSVSELIKVKFVCETVPSED